MGEYTRDYLSENILINDPFMGVDEEGVGKLMQMAVTLGRQVRKDLHIGICGEQWKI